MSFDRLIRSIVTSLLILAAATATSARDIRLQPLKLDAIGELRIVDGTIKGYDINACGVRILGPRLAEFISPSLH